MSAAPEMGMGAEGLAVPTGVQAAGLKVVVDCNVPPAGLQEITTLPPVTSAVSVAGWPLVGGVNVP